MRISEDNLQCLSHVFKSLIKCLFTFLLLTNICYVAIILLNFLVFNDHMILY